MVVRGCVPGTGLDRARDGTIVEGTDPRAGNGPLIGAEDEALDLLSRREREDTGFDVAFADGDGDAHRRATRELRMVDRELIAAGAHGRKLEDALRVAGGGQVGVPAHVEAAAGVAHRRHHGDAGFRHGPFIGVDDPAPGPVAAAEDDVEGFLGAGGPGAGQLDGVAHEPLGFDSDQVGGLAVETVQPERPIGCRDRLVIPAVGAPPPIVGARSCGVRSVLRRVYPVDQQARFGDRVSAGVGHRAGERGGRVQHGGDDLTRRLGLLLRMQGAVRRLEQRRQAEQRRDQRGREPARAGRRLPSTVPGSCSHAIRPEVQEER